MYLLQYYTGQYDPSWPMDEWSQRAGVQYILDTVVRELAADTSRRWQIVHQILISNATDTSSDEIIHSTAFIFWLTALSLLIFLEVSQLTKSTTVTAMLAI